MSFQVTAEPPLASQEALLVQSVSLSALQGSAEKVAKCLLRAPNNQANLGNDKRRALLFNILMLWKPVS